MRFLLLSSCFFFLAGCSSVYKNLQPTTGNVSAVRKFKPDFKVALYNTEVNVTSHHLSGLLLIKKMPDSSLRMVFSNEMGVKFFDFQFLPDGSFKVFYIIKQMDKKPVITTLMKDFDLVLMRHMNDNTASILKQDGHVYYKFPQSKGFNYYITNTAGDSLIRMERSSKRRPVVVAIMKNYKDGIPDTIGIEHKTFKFMIGLKRIER
jgi:hypothetical protein